VIRFTLCCDAGHRFDGWFSGSQSYEDQKDSGALACPFCGSVSVDKALMTPAVATQRKAAPIPATAHVPEPPPEAVAVLRRIRERLVQDADNVGDRFAEEARRIHYDEAEKRGIYGKASLDEVRALAEEGIEFHPLPVLPEDHN
jgi:hypothetical protein